MIRLLECFGEMRKRSWLWVGIGEAASAVLAAVLAYLINVLSGEKQIRASVLAGVVALVAFSALFAWGRRAIEARSASHNQQGDDPQPPAASSSATISDDANDSQVVISGGAPVVILSKVRAKAISLDIG
jgi:hypothetical protein